MLETIQNCQIKHTKDEPYHRHIVGHAVLRVVMVTFMFIYRAIKDAMSRGVRHFLVDCPDHAVERSALFDGPRRRASPHTSLLGHHITEDWIFCRGISCLLLLFLLGGLEAQFTKSNC